MRTESAFYQHHRQRVWTVPKVEIWSQQILNLERPSFTSIGIKILYINTLYYIVVALSLFCWLKDANFFVIFISPSHWSKMKNKQIDTRGTKQSKIESKHFQKILILWYFMKNLGLFYPRKLFNILKEFCVGWWSKNCIKF